MEENKLNPFERTIKEYLDNRAAEDEAFAERYANENKSIEECCKYIISQAKENGREGYADAEVYGWAVHYYDEDELEFDENVEARVVVNHEVVLTEEEKADLKAKAMEEYKQSQVREIKQTVVKTIKKVEESQLSLF